MAIEKSFEKFKSDYLRKIKDYQQVVGSNIDLAAKGGIKKLLTAVAKVKITGTEVLSGELKLAGRISYKLIYVDGEGQLKSGEYSSDFNETIKDDSLKATEAIYCRAEISDVDSATIADEVKLQAVANISIFAVESKEFEALVAIDGALKKSRNTHLQSYSGNVSDGFELSEEIETGADVDDIIVADASVCVASVKAENKRVGISGEVNALLVYRSEGAFVSKCINMPFSESLDALGAEEGVEVCVDAFVRDTKIAITGVEGNNIVRFEVAVGVKAPIFIPSSQCFVTDVCAADYDLKIEKEEIEYSRYAFSRFFTEKVSGSAMLGQEMESIKHILFALPTSNFTANIIPASASLTVEGLLSVSVVYEDEEDKLCSVMVELPYSLCFDCESVSSNDVLQCFANAGCVSAKVRRDREIEVTAELCFDARINKAVFVEFIPFVEEGEQFVRELKGLCVYVCAKGETLWDAAKALLAPIEAIAAQNALKEDAVFEGGEKIIFFRELSVS